MKAVDRNVQRRLDRQALTMRREFEERIANAAKRAHENGLREGHLAGYNKGVAAVEAEKETSRKEGLAEGAKGRKPSPLASTKVRFFVLRRDEDESGISGAGIVAEGAEFSNGSCALSWLTPMHSVASYPNIKQLEAIHGHDGKTKVVFS